MLEINWGVKMKKIMVAAVVLAAIGVGVYLLFVCKTSRQYRGIFLEARMHELGGSLIADY